MEVTRDVQISIEALRKASVKGKTKKSVLENIDNVSSSALLLISSSPSSLTFDKLVSVFRSPLVPLYSSYTEHALNVASAILKVILNKLAQTCSVEGEKRDQERQTGWERVAHSLLSGVIDFLESNTNDKTKTSIAKALYAPICNFFFLKDGINTVDIGVTLHCTAYMLLSDAATLHHGNQSRLRDQKLLGAHALGSAISRTRDFAVLEALLNLFAILLPSSSTPKKRHSYIQDVFSDFKEIVELVNGMNSGQWDETSAKVIDILANSDISFPQPFDVDEVVVCGNKYPQPEVSDRLYVDKACFFVNVRQEDDLYEDLQIKYTSVQDVKIASSRGTVTPVSLSLKTAPKLGDQEIRIQTKPLTLRVNILNRDVPRFKDALQYRELGEAIGVARRSRVSVSAEIDLDEYGSQWQDGTPLSIHTSVSRKAKELESLYGLDPPQAMGSEEQAAESSTLSRAATPTDDTDIPPQNAREYDETKVNSPDTSKLDQTIFGGTDEELSDIDEANPGKTKSQGSTAKGNELASASATLKNVIILSDDDEAPSKLSGSGSTEDSAFQKKDKDTSDVKASKKSAKEATTTVRPRRVAAAAASAKLLQTFLGSEENAATTSSRAFPELSKLSSDTEKLDVKADGSENASSSGEVISKGFTAQQGKAVKPGTRRAPRTLETADIRSSSPTSKISKMKAKLPVKVKSKEAKGRKRSSDKATITDDEKSLLKKPRVSWEVAEKSEDIDGVEDKSRTPPARLSQKYGRRGRKVQASTLKKPVDWDKVPAEPAAESERHEELPVTPVKPTAPVKIKEKKENIVVAQDKPKSQTLAVNNPEMKSRARSRKPLQTIPLTPNKASEKPDVETMSDAELDKPVSKTPKTRELASNAKTDAALRNKIPSLEDILLKGSVVERLDTEPKLVEVINLVDDDKVDANFETGPPEDLTFDAVMDFDDGPDNSTVKKCAASHSEEPSTPSSKKSKEAGLFPREKRLKDALEQDDDMIDLTEEDIEQVLKTLRERRTKKEREIGSASPSRTSTKEKVLEIEERGSLDEENSVPTLQIVPSRPKVAFDDKPRYKSASLESIPAQEFAGLRTTVAPRKYRLPQNKDTSRRPIEPVTLRRQARDEQPKREPGMEDIINVLDSIQNVIVSNISHKSNAVRSDVRAARDRLIHEAVADLDEMREESVGHYNNLLLLENGYANMSRKLNTNFERVTKINADICNFIKRAMTTHNRGTVSKEMPKSLIASGLPACFQKFT